MVGFRLPSQTPPPAKRITDVVVSRFDGVFEVDPALMGAHVRQQEIPNWDFQRIVASRLDHLAWMHAHFADAVISGEELLAEIAAEDGDEGAVGGPPEGGGPAQVAIAEGAAEGQGRTADGGDGRAAGQGQGG